jgi:hypothetical protein
MSKPKVGATDALLDHLAGPPPDGLDELVELFHAVANAKGNGKPYARERVSRDRVRSWLLGENMLTEEQRVWLDAARRKGQLGSAYRRMLKRLKDPEWRTIRWHAP